MVLIPYYPGARRGAEEDHRAEAGQDSAAHPGKPQASRSPTIDAFVEEVASRCTEVESGARNVDNILTNSLLPDMSRQILGRMAEGEKLTSIHIGIGADGSFTYS